MIYKGIISGVGNETTRENEITPDVVASYRKFVVGHESGVIDEGDIRSFTASIISATGEWKRYSNVVHVNAGTMFAYGYFGEAEAADFTFLPPAVEQYHIIYAELDKSVIPNKCTIKTKNNQGSSRIIPNTFRQDELSTVKTGIYQLPLWIIKITQNGIESIYLPRSQYDLRNIVDNINNVVEAEEAYTLKGTVAKNAIVQAGYTYPEDGVADREYVQELIWSAINK